jgi:hypothetical protein
MTFKDALATFKSLLYQKITTDSLRVTGDMYKDWILINSNLHLYYVAINVGDTDTANDCINDIFDVLENYDITDVDLPEISGGVGGGVVPTNGFLDWVPGTLNYLLYSTQQAGVSMDSSSTDPVSTSRVNINGDTHATRLSSPNVDVRDGGVMTLRKQVVGSDTNGDVRLRADALGYYIERRESGNWIVKGDITF